MNNNEGYIGRNFATFNRVAKMIFQKHGNTNWNHAEKMLRQMLYRESKNVKVDTES